MWQKIHLNFHSKCSFQDYADLQLQEAAFCVGASMEQLRLLLSTEARLLP